MNFDKDRIVMMAICCMMMLVLLVMMACVISRSHDRCERQEWTPAAVRAADRALISSPTARACVAARDWIAEVM